MERMVCKKCGDSYGRSIRYYNDKWRITCPKCSYCTNLKDSYEQAEEAWNDRRTIKTPNKGS